MLINGVEFEVDLLDADEAERIEQIFDAASAEFCSRREELDALSASQSIREQCGIIFKAFDKILGDGAHEKIFGARTNLETCLDTFGQFVFDLHNSRVEKINAMTDRWDKMIAPLKENHDEPAV